MKLRRLIAILLISFIAIFPIACSMGQTRYDLCNTPVIGLIMYPLFLCASSPLIPETDISLLESGVVLKTIFKARIEKSYKLILSFYFPKDQDRDKDNIIGGPGYDGYCRSCLEECNSNRMSESEEYRKSYGTMIPIRVIVTKLSDSTVVVDKTFQTVCSIASGANDKWRDIGWIKLTEGKYSIEIINTTAQPELKGIQTKIGLYMGGH